MVVISLFDGISCWQLSLQRANIAVAKYYSSEIDKYASSISKSRFPDTIFLGSVENVKGFYADLLIGGSPCQSFSSLGDGSGFNGKSKLFWHFVRILREVRELNPDVKFLFENVSMKKEWQNIITKELGVKPIRINSNLVSAQNRERFYWTNILVNSLPQNKNIKLADILETNVDEKYYLSEKAIAYITNKERIEKKFTQINGEKSICLSKQYNLSKNGTFLCVDANGRIDSQTTGTLTKRYAKGVETFGSNPFIYDGRFRKLTPIECERLQTLPDNYTYGISDTQRYFSIGNGWTVDIISHILKHINL